MILLSQNINYNDLTYSLKSRLNGSKNISGFEFLLGCLKNINGDETVLQKMKKKGKKAKKTKVNK